MKKFYFTFGFGQKHENGYHIIEAETRKNAREIMCRQFGMEWSVQYDNAEEAGVEEFGLRRVF